MGRRRGDPALEAVTNPSRGVVRERNEEARWRKGEREKG